MRFLVGAFNDDSTFEIVEDYVAFVSRGGSCAPCPHCTEVRPPDPAYPTSPYADLSYRVRRAVVATNQGGHDMTVVCLDCILAAVTKMEGR